MNLLNIFFLVRHRRGRSINKIKISSNMAACINQMPKLGGISPCSTQSLATNSILAYTVKMSRAGRIFANRPCLGRNTLKGMANKASKIVRSEEHTSELQSQFHLV